jgi:hypothetical protein
MTTAQQFVQLAANGSVAGPHFAQGNFLPPLTYPLSTLPGSPC